MKTSLYEELVEDLNDVHQATKAFWMKWLYISNYEGLTQEQMLKMQMMMDQFDAWYEEFVDASK